MIGVVKCFRLSTKNGMHDKAGEFPGHSPQLLFLCCDMSSSVWSMNMDEAFHEYTDGGAGRRM